VGVDHFGLGKAGKRHRGVQRWVLQRVGLGPRALRATGPLRHIHGRRLRTFETAPSNALTLCIAFNINISEDGGGTLGATPGNEYSSSQECQASEFIKYQK
jgi:hypothetical protein